MESLCRQAQQIQTEHLEVASGMPHLKPLQLAIQWRPALAPIHTQTQQQRPSHVCLVYQGAASSDHDLFPCQQHCHTSPHLQALSKGQASHIRHQVPQPSCCQRGQAQACSKSGIDLLSSNQHDEVVSEAKGDEGHASSHCQGCEGTRARPGDTASRGSILQPAGLEL